MSRSMRGQSFSRRGREISAAGSATQGMADAGFAGTADPACCPPWRLRQLRSIEGETPSRRNLDQPPTAARQQGDRLLLELIR